jgi:hypothetical protein
MAKDPSALEVKPLPQKYFHCGPVPLAPGSIIEPGNWGRIIRLYLPSEQATFPIAYREAVLEAARLALAPEKPSRLHCVFGLPTLDSAIVYKNKYGRLNFIYEIEPTTDAPRIHMGDYELVGLEPNVPYFDQYPLRAAAYWSDGPKDAPEILLDCPIRILHRC